MCEYIISVDECNRCVVEHNHVLVSITSVDKYNVQMSITYVLVSLVYVLESITYVFISVPCVFWSITYVLVRMAYVLASITYALVSITYVLLFTFCNIVYDNDYCRRRKVTCNIELQVFPH